MARRLLRLALAIGTRPDRRAHACLTLGGTHVEDHSSPGFRAVFRRCTGDVGGRNPMVDHALGISAPFLASEATRLAGLAFIVAGVPGLLDSFARFALQGLGTQSANNTA